MVSEEFPRVTEPKWIGATGTLTNTGFTESITRAAYTPAEGLAFDRLLERMRVGTVYVNIHTQNPGRHA